VQGRRCFHAARSKDTGHFNHRVDVIRRVEEGEPASKQGEENDAD
jgi:hypothetical protein